MKLNQYITEDTEIDEIAAKIKKDCQPYLRILRKGAPALIRGTRDNLLNPLSKKQSHPDRIPKDMPKWLHDYSNVMLKKRHGWEVRNGVSVSTESWQVEGYGKTYIMLPIGKFTWAYVPGQWDFYNFLKHQFNDYAGKAHNVEYTDIKHLQKEEMTDGAWMMVDAALTDYQSERSWEQHSGEIMIGVKSYYLFDFKRYPRGVVPQMFEDLGIKLFFFGESSIYYN